MKQKIFLFFAASFLSIFTYGQTTDTLTEKVFKNEIGIDATSLFTNIFKGTYSSPYAIQYQQHIRQSAIRFTLGGIYDTNNHLLDTGSYEEYSKSIALKLEYLHYFKLDYHWYLFMGIGVIYSIEDRLTGYPINSNSYINYQDTKTENTGGNLLVGLQYKISSRINASIEGNLKILSSQTTRFNYSQVLVGSGVVPSDYYETVKSTEIQFTPPINFTLSFYF